MDELLQAMYENNLHDVCLMSAQQICQNKLKQLLNLAIHEYANNYLNINLCSISFIFDRLRKIIQNMKDLKKGYHSRIIRISICEIFIYLIQIPRYPIAIVSNFKGEPSIPKGYHDGIIFHIPYNQCVNSTHIDSNRCIDILKSYFIGERNVESKLSRLLYCVTKRDFEGIRTHILWIIHRTKTIALTKNISFSLNDDNTEASTTDKNDGVTNDFVGLLFLIAICSSPKEHQPWCNKLAYIYFTNYAKSTKISRINILFLAYKICICSMEQFDRVFNIKNKYLNKTVLQCALKIDYIYQDICDKHESINIYDENILNKKKELYRTDREYINECENNEDNEDNEIHKEAKHSTQNMIDYYQTVLFSAPLKDKAVVSNLNRIKEACKIKIEQFPENSRKFVTINGSK